MNREVEGFTEDLVLFLFFPSSYIHFVYPVPDASPFASSVQKLLGSPDDASLRFLRSDNARRYVKQLPQYPRQQFKARFPNMSPLAIDLLEKMLVFDPNRRITGKLLWFTLLHKSLVRLIIVSLII